MEITKAYLALEGYGDLHYRSAGHPSKPTIVLLHQAPSSSEMFELLMRELATDYFLWAPDMPGFGGSPLRQKQMSIEGLAAICVSAVNKLGMSEYFLFGHHTGTAVATALAGNNSSVKKLLLSGPALLSDELKKVLPSRATPFAMQESGQHLIQHWDRMRGKDAGVPLALTQREMLLALQMEDRFLQAYHAAVHFDFEKALNAIEVPTLLCSGSNDVLVDSVALVAVLLRKRREPPPVNTEIISQAGSYVCETHSAELAAIIRAFCR